MLTEAEIPQELCEITVIMSGNLIDMVSLLRSSIESISSNLMQAVDEAKKVGDIERKVDGDYLKIKSLFVKYGATLNYGAMVIFDDLIEFMEQAADMCADTADYIDVLSSRD